MNLLSLLLLRTSARLRAITTASALSVLGCAGDAAPSGTGADSGSEPEVGVVHLIDAWSRVVAAEGDLLELALPEQLSPRLDRATEAGQGWRFHPLPWPSRDGTVRYGDEVLEPGAEGRRGREPAVVPASRRFEAGEFDATGEFKPAFGDTPESWSLGDGDSASLWLECAGGRTQIDIGVRAVRGGRARLVLEQDGSPVHEFPLQSKVWTVVRVPAWLGPGRHELRLRVHDEDESGRRIVQLAAIEKRGTGPDQLLLPAAAEPARVRYAPRLPGGAEEFEAASALDPAERRRRVDFLSLGGLVRVLPAGDTELKELSIDGRPFEVAPGAACAFTSGEDGTSRLHRIEWTASGPAGVRIEQPRCSLLPFLLRADFGLDDDLSTEREGGELPATIAPRFLGRVECAHDRRAALFLPGGSALQFELELRAGDRLRFATGRPELGDFVLPSAVDFEVRWEREDHPREQQLHSSRQDPGGPRSWEDHEIVVRADQAGRGRLSFRTRCEAGFRSPAAFADPRVVPAGLAADRARPDLLLYVIDTLRADGLGCYGSGRETSPALDRIAAQGYRFERVYSVSSWTRPAIGTMMTGLYPPYHGILNGFRPLPFSMLTLAELLRAEGYSTAAVVSNVQVDARGVHFEQGFHRFLASRGLGLQQPEFQTDPSSRRVHAEARRWLESTEGEPSLLYLHSMDPHMPYLPPEEYRRRFDPEYTGLLEDVPLTDSFSLWKRIDALGPRDFDFVRSVYDAEVRCQDDEIDRLWAWLEETGRLEDTVVVFVSDHGEEFYEHGSFSHQGQMWELHLRVPWIVWIPPRFREGLSAPPRVLDEPVSLVDLLPTLLSLLGVEDRVPRHGRDLRPLLTGGTVEPRTVYAQESRGLSALVDPPWKVVRREKNGVLSHELFHLGDDPEEQDELGARRPQVLQSMLAKLAARKAALDAGPHPSRVDVDERVDFDREDRARLSALGYLQPRTDPPDPPPEEDR